MKIADMHLETGDIILTSKNSIIALFMRLFQKDPVYWGHVAIAKNTDYIWEAHFKLQEISKQKFFKEHKHYKHFKIIRKINLSEQQKEKMLKIAPKLLGRSYSLKRIWWQLLDQITHSNKFTKKHQNKFEQVCSSYAGWIYWVACKYKFNNIPWQSLDPDDIEDNQLAHPDEWVVVQTKELYRRK